MNLFLCFEVTLASFVNCDMLILLQFFYPDTRLSLSSAIMGLYYKEEVQGGRREWTGDIHGSFLVDAADIHYLDYI